MTRVVLTRHAIRRYQERVKPALDVGQAREDLNRLLDACSSTPQTDAPYWLNGDGDAYLQICPGIWLSLLRDERETLKWVATTVLVDGGFSPERRAAKNKRRQDRRARRRWAGKDRRPNRRAEPDREAA